MQASPRVNPPPPPRGAVASLRAAFSTLFGPGWPSVLTAIPIIAVGTVLSLGLIGLPIVGYGLSILVKGTLEGSPRSLKSAPARRIGWAGLASLIGLSLVLGAQLMSLAIIDTPIFEEVLRAYPLVPFAAGLVAPTLIAAALAPLLFIAPILATGAPAKMAFRRSLEFSARLGPRRIAWLGARVGLLTSATVGLVTLLFVLGSDEQGFPIGGVLVSLPFALCVAPLLPTAMVANVYASLEEGRAEADELGTLAVPRLKAIAYLLVPSFVLLAVALMTAAFHPIPMARVTTAELGRGLHPQVVIGATPQRIRPPGTDLVVTNRGGGVDVIAGDGGGAGHIPGGFGPFQTGMLVRPGVFGGEPGYEVLLFDDDRWVHTWIDRGGVRMDDTLRVRVGTRLGSLGLMVLSLALLLSLVLSYRLGTDLSSARLMQMPDLLGTTRPPPAGSLKVLVGTLRGAGKGKLKTGLLSRLLGSPGRFVHEGEVFFEGADLQIMVPVKVPMMSFSGAPEVGSKVLLLSSYTELSPSGLREAASPWPSDGLLVVGDRQQAARALVARAGNLAAWLAPPILACLVGASALVLSHL